MDCKQQRYVVQKSVTAALDFAAVMAQSSRLFASYEEDYPGFSKRALLAAEKAYAWAEKHPGAYYNQNLLNQKYQPAIAPENMVTHMQTMNFSGRLANSISQPEKRYTGKKQ